MVECVKQPINVMWTRLSITVDEESELFAKKSADNLNIGY